MQEAMPRDVEVRAGVIRMNRNESVTGPVPAEIFVSGARVAESVREDDDGEGTRTSCGRVDSHGNQALTCGVAPDNVRDFHVVGPWICERCKRRRRVEARCGGGT